ncbi:MAG: TonB-dependent receptor [Burkholderiales bacterium]
MRFQRRKVAIALGVGSVALVAGGAATAQDIRVNVTGSNIKRVDSETAAPIETITREDIQQSGLNTISEVVRRITANSNGTIGDSFTNGFAGGGATGVSLRGLGSNNTLVLINGRRLANTGLADDGQYSFVDLNQIPFDLVDRIEILKDGASAIYGSDAVAGVINVILRQQFTGVTVTGTGGINYQGDGGMFKAAITAGIGDLTKDRYNAYVSVDYMKQDSVPLTSLRSYMGTSDLRFMGLPDTRNGAPPSGYGTGSLVGSLRPVNPATGGLIGAGPYTTLPGCDPANEDTTLGPRTNAFCRFEQKEYLDLIPESDRFNIFGRAQYNLTDTISIYGEASYFQFKSDNRSTPSQPRSTWPNVAGSTVNNSTTIFLPVGHPDNPFNSQGYGARLYYAAGDVGGRDSHIENTVQRYLGGIKGSNYGWDWDAGLMYIRNETDQTRYGFFNYANLQQALLGQGGFGYYRIGQNASLNNPGIYDFIAPAISNNVLSENTQFDAKASRDIYKMEGGQMALAVGYEFRREELNNPGTTGTYTGNVVGLGYSAASASRNINAVYAELYMPILKNLEITAALRYDDYSDFGGTWNPKVGVKWTVVPQLVARGTYATAFRAPGPYENGNSAAAGFTSINDPVRCPVTGNAADCSGTVVAITSGNPQIQPETSTTWTVGLIWEPVPSFNASIDYWNITTNDKITGADPQAVLDNPAGFPSATIVRDTNNLPGIPNSGTVLAVAAPYENADKVFTDGIDVAATWRLPLGDYGRLTTTLEWTHIFTFERTIGGTTYQYAGTHGPTSLSSSAGMPQDRANLVLAWDRGPWNVAGTIRYVGPMDNIESDQQPDCLTFAANGYCTVASFTTLDLSAAYKGFKNWEIFGSVINVFNRLPPFDRQAGYGAYNFNYNYAFSGAMGTYFNLGARYTFQ